MHNLEATQDQVLSYLEKICGTMPKMSDSLALIGIDSVAMAEMTFDFEKQFSFKVTDDILEIETVEELVMYIFENQGTESHPGN
ncbi:MAG: phosphopantetheine-binding protein [Planctomycetota bacterium]|jgi:acyl carrier protein